MKKGIHIYSHFVILFGFMLLFMAAFLAFPSHADAADSISIGSTDISSNNDGAQHSIGSGYYILSTDRKTLTLNNVSCTSKTDIALNVSGDISIVLSGTNSFTTTADTNGSYKCAINVDGDLSISGDGYLNATTADGNSLIVSGKLTVDGGYIYARNNSDARNCADAGYLETNGGCLYALNSSNYTYAPGLTIYQTAQINNGSVISTMIDINDKMTQSGGLVQSTGGIYLQKNAEVSGGKLAATGTVRIFDDATFKDGAQVEAGVFSAYGDLYVSGSAKLKANDYIEYCGLLDQSGGEITSAGDISTSSDNATGNEKMECSGGSMSSTGMIKSVLDMEISGSASVTAGEINSSSLTVNGGTVTAKNTSGNALNISKDLKMTGGTVSAEGATYIGGNLTCTGGTVSAEGDVNIGGNLNCSGGTVSAEGATNIKGNLACSGGTVSAEGATDIEGSFSLTKGTVRAITDGDCALIIRGDAKIEGGEIYCEGGYWRAVCCLGKLDISGGRFEAKRLNEEDGTESLIDAYNTKVAIGADMWISTPTDAYTTQQSSPSKETFDIFDAEGKQANSAVIQKASSIAVKNGPSITENAFVNDVFDPAGLVITATFADGSETDISYNEYHSNMFGFTPAASSTLTAGQASVNISCLTKQCTMTFEVKGFGAPAISGTASKESTVLSWNAVDGASCYRVYSKDRGSSSWDGPRETTGVSFEDSGIEPGEQRDYYVEAVRISNTGSEITSQSSVKTITNGLTAPVLSVMSVGSDSASLEWTSVEGADSYQVCRDNCSDSDGFLILGTVTDTSFDDSGLTTSVKYAYYVMAVNATSGVTSPRSNYVYVTPEAEAEPEPEPEPEPAPIVVPTKDDPAGTVFSLLQARATKAAKTSVKISWKKVPGAAKYVVYGNKCGTKNKYKELLTTTKLNNTFKNVAGKKVKKGTYYKFIVYALDSRGGVISTSKTVHVATKGGKVGNDKKVTTNAKKSKVTLKKGKTFKLKAKAVPASKKLKVHRHRKIAYESSNKKIATVTKKGVIKGIAPGTCYVFAYTQNGIFARVKVTVK